MSELVSIVLPVYNGEKYLSESIDSIIAQTYQNWELIIVDDCSSDNSPEIAKNYSERDNRIQYFRNEKNLKLPRSLNKGFSLTKGEFLTWTSDDNRYRNNALEFLVSEIKKSHCQFVFTAFCRIDENGKKIDDIVYNENIVRMIPVRNVVGASFMYTRSVYNTVGDYDDTLFLTEDFDYWQRIYGHYGAKYCQEIVYDYRLHNGALTETRRDQDFYRSLCSTLEKNRKLFGEFSLEQNYYYFNTLSRSKRILKEKDKYRYKNYYYSFIWYWKHTFPRKVTRAINRVTNQPKTNTL